MKIKILVKRSENSKTDTFEMESAYCIVGRKNSNLNVPDPRCSSQHALIYEGPDTRLWLKDLESTNGTLVNNKRVEESPLFLGDEIRIGKTTLVLLEYAPAIERTAVTSPNLKRPTKSEKMERTQDTAINVEMTPRKGPKPPPEIVVKDAEADILPVDHGLITQWPENMYAMPKRVQEKFVEYIDEKGTQTRIRLADLLKAV